MRQQDSKQDMKITSLQKDIEYIKETVGEIKIQTTKTNGMVSENEKKIAKTQFWINAVSWGSGVLWTFLVALVAIVAPYLYSNLVRDITDEVVDALENGDIVIEEV